ncbi:acyl-CoA carboxylase subunit epsilon [Streptomyces sp. NPDC046853]|uniref:acyl-CoA carboxylase subunit epsilon n=1 Tax=Streptomyces sp. NPDC046853 TaxID=3154920 RepID=UPI0034042CFB
MSAGEGQPRRAAADTSGPLLVVTAGNPTSEELAAVTVALLDLARVRPAEPVAPPSQAAWHRVPVGGGSGGGAEPRGVGRGRVHGTHGGRRGRGL